MRRTRWWRYASLVGGSGLLFQLAGCNFDQATLLSLFSALAPIVIEGLMGTVTPL
jgi:hypothetical protein